MTEILTAAIPFVMSAAALIISIRSFLEKGFLLNNAYIYASKQEKMRMDKSPHYRQSGIVFLLVGMIFLLIGIQALLDVKWIFYVEAILVIAAAIYAVVSSVMIEKQKNDRAEE
ncbi:MAG: DUF3784 domain-containing protein [Lachnospiraceae bacterium]|nr:DUF3784 domain-containing protein [Lachnospiraceae bacterium]